MGLQKKVPAGLQSDYHDLRQSALIDRIYRTRISSRLTHDSSRQRIAVVVCVCCYSLDGTLWDACDASEDFVNIFKTLK